MKSYNYQHRDGVLEIGWNKFAQYSKMLAELLAKEDVDIIVGIARAGLIPATTVACMMRKDLYPIRLTRRLNDEVVSKKPEWKVSLQDNVVAGKHVVVVDEIADTGETLDTAANRIRESGAKKVITAALFAHTWAKPKPDIVMLETDALLLFPWNARVYQDGVWKVHPELVDVLGSQDVKK